MEIASNLYMNLRRIGIWTILSKTSIHQHGTSIYLGLSFYISLTFYIFQCVGFTPILLTISHIFYAFSLILITIAFQLYFHITHCRNSADSFFNILYFSILFLFFIILKMIFIFSVIVGLQCSVNFLQYSKVSQSHIHVCIHWQFYIDLIPYDVVLILVDFCFCPFLGPHPRHMQVPRLGV